MWDSILPPRDARGQYNLQRIKNNSFRIFSSYDGKIYSSHTTFNYNRHPADENGGVTDDSDITDTTFKFSKEIPTLFGGIDQTNEHEPDVYREIRNISFFTIQEASFRKLFSSSDTTDKPQRIKLFYPKLAYIFSLDRSKVLFIDKNPSVGYDAGLYPGCMCDARMKPRIPFSTGKCRIPSGCSFRDERIITISSICTYEA